MRHPILPEPTIPTLSVNAGILGRSDCTGEKRRAPPYAAPPGVYGVYGVYGEFEFPLEPLAPMLARASREGVTLNKKEAKFEFEA
jgi:hypothetical protein